MDTIKIALVHAMPNKSTIKRKYLVHSSPGGQVERGHDLFETIKNEVKEETGLLVEVKEIIHTFSSAKTKF